MHPYQYEYMIEFLTLSKEKLSIVFWDINMLVMKFMSMLKKLLSKFEIKSMGDYHGFHLNAVVLL